MARFDAPLPVRAGDVLVGKYKVERVLGAGGMGYVVAARHLELGARVAIKLLRPEVHDEDALARFSREARAMFRLKSEHVGKVLDIGRLPDGSPFMVMEYLVGTDLGAHLQARGRLPVPEALDYVLQACEAVAEAHALGIVHRDIKPPNLFLSRRVDGSARVKVLDFGISKIPDSSDEKMRLTHASTIMGSPFYMSPEQLRSSASADARSDVWALGIVLYELLSGAVPFTAESPAALYAKLLEEDPRPLHEVVPDVPPGLSAVIHACLARKPERRVQSVEELAARLEPFGGPALAGAAARVAAVRAALPPESAGEDARIDLALHGRAHGEGVATGTAWEGSDSSKRRARLLSAVIVGGGAAALLLIGVVWALLARSVGGPSTTTASVAASNDTRAPDAAPSLAAPATVDTSVVALPSAPVDPTSPRTTPPREPARPTKTVVPTRGASSAPRGAASFDPYDSRTWGTAR